MVPLLVTTIHMLKILDIQRNSIQLWDHPHVNLRFHEWRELVSLIIIRFKNNIINHQILPTQNRINASIIIIFFILEICQIRLDFTDLELTGPTAATGNCGSDTLVATPGAANAVAQQKPPTLCGTNTGHHGKCFSSFCISIISYVIYISFMVSIINMLLF